MSRSQRRTNDRFPRLVLCPRDPSCIRPVCLPQFVQSESHTGDEKEPRLPALTILALSPALPALLSGPQAAF